MLMIIINLRILEIKNQNRLEQVGIIPWYKKYVTKYVRYNNFRDNRIETEMVRKFRREVHRNDQAIYIKIQSRFRRGNKNN